MKRRKFLGLLGGAAIAYPLAARGQPARRAFRIGMLPLGSPSSAYDQSLVNAFRQGLQRAGLVEDRDIVLDVVWVGDDPDQAVRELIERGVDLLVPCGSSASVAAKRRTSVIPIVFLSVGNPIAMNLVDSLPRPGRNATGFADILADLSSKLVDLAREMNRRGKPWTISGIADGLTACIVTKEPSRPPNPRASSFNPRRSATPPPLTRPSKP
jgi:putative ABC transport system substrate-binding protein